MASAQAPASQLPIWLLRLLAATALTSLAVLPWWATGLTRSQEFLHALVDNPRGLESWRPELMRLPAGSVLIRPDAPADDCKKQSKAIPEDEQRYESVAITELEVCRSEVTVAQWKAVLERSPEACGFGCRPELPVHGFTRDEALVYLSRLTESENRIRTRDGLPALSPCYTKEGNHWRWSDPNCTGYRLPTSGEWDYFARAGSRHLYFFGDDPAGLCTAANIDAKSIGCDDGSEGPALVQNTPANPWGLLGIHGNVSELVWSSQMDEARGGSYLSPACAAVSHARSKAEDARADLGLRCVRTVRPEPSSKT